MLIFLLTLMFRTVDSSFVDYDDVGLLKCNWAEAYWNDEEIVNVPEIQHDIMLLASHWEGKFGQHGVGADLELALLSAGCKETIKYGCVADYDSGLIHSCPHGFLEIYQDAIHMALLAMALNGSPYACQFFRSSMQSYWHGTLETFLIDQLEKKIRFYETVNRLYPGFSGLFDSIQWNETMPYPVPNIVYFRPVGYMTWPMLAISRMLRDNAKTAALGQRYANYVQLIASNFLMIFYRGDGDFNAEMTVLNGHAQPSPDNYREDDQQDHQVYPMDDELTLYFAYFFVNWTTRGGDEERRKMWQNLRSNTAKVPYNFINDSIIEVEVSLYYSSTERFKYLYLPYLDVAEQEKLHLIGELARTHYSAGKRIPGLFTYGWQYVIPADYKENVLYCGIPELGKKHCAPNDQAVCPSAAFSMILNPKMRGVGLVWYMTMLRNARMQGPFGGSACVKLPGTSVSVSMKWNSKLYQLLAFDGGLVTIVRDILNETGHLNQFYGLVRENIAIFRTSNTFINDTHQLFMPSARLKNDTRRFNACSAQVYDRSKAKPTALLVSQETSRTVLYVTIASAVLVLIALICMILTILRRAMKRHMKRMDLINNQSRPSRRDGEWEVDDEELHMENEPIGKGAFAVVFKGVLTVLPPIHRNGSRSRIDINLSIDSKQITVAVKCPADDTERLDFANEIEFMKTIGYNSRLVNMLACISGAGDQKLVLEYCANGNLFEYLHDIHEQLKTNIKFPNLTSLAWQINEGMIYLSSINIVHRDLSARNILLTAGHCAKISDFGLARMLINNEYKSNGEKLPFRILSPEAISQMIFSMESDVWAYGVLLYEIFSFGDTPYSSMSEASILQFLIAGNRLDRPLHANDFIYSLMKLCWQFEAFNRPAFAQIGAILRAEMETNSAAYGYLSMDMTDENF